MILNVVLALVSGVLLFLLFPPFGFAWLAPFAIAPLLIACARARRPALRFALGYATGLVYWFGLASWIETTAAEHAGVNTAVAWCLFALLCFLKALQTGLFAALAGTVIQRWFAIPAIAALWVAIEYTHAWTGLEWLNLGNVASEMSVPLRLAPFTGVWGLSFLFAMLGAAVASVILRRRLASLWLLPLIALLLLLPAIPEFEKGASAAIIVQPNIDDEATWTPALLEETKDRIRLFALSLSGVKADRRTDLIVLPEMPAPFYAGDPNFLAWAGTLAADSGAPVLTSAIARSLTGAPLNSALLIGAAGKPLSRYDKVHLVPFGEFVPWPFAVIAAKVSAEAGDFEAGHNAVVTAIGGHRIATFICYESVFPGYVRGFAASGAEVLLNISNDSWFGKSAARYQHLLIVRMRAVENRRWILRATNNGISGAIDPAGRLVRALPEYREAAASLQYGYIAEQTFYTRHGDWFVLLCALLAGFALIARKAAPAPVSALPE